MRRTVCLLLCLAACCNGGPLAGHQKKHRPALAREDSVTQEMQQESLTAPAEVPTNSATTAAAAPLGTLTLPSNATSIRADITDNFSCANKSYGYYADVENDCQIFHVCLPVTYADGKENTFRWSFICPEETIFSQESFTCMRREDMTIECEDSYRYYELNGNFGAPIEEDKDSNMKPAAAAAPASASDNEETAAMPTADSEEQDMAEPVVTAAPVKVQKPKPKPNRRKPAVTYNKPQRRVPAVVTAAPIIEAVEEVAPAVEVAPIVHPVKLLKPQRFGLRPNKEKPQIVKPTAMPQRNELFNAIRKRPAVYSTTAKPQQEVEPAVTEAIVQAPLELSEPQPTLKLQTLFVDDTSAVEKNEEPAAQASEPVEAIVSLETEKPADTEVKQQQAETIETEVQPIEAIEEMPAVILESLDQQPQEIASPVEQQSVQPAEAETIIAEPAIIEPSSSHEEALNTIEEMEAAKPADAPESLPATPEMTQPNPIVEQMLDTNIETQESLGGFKPVDPVMAAEAEQLINDFLNTLRKHEEEKSETDLANAAMNMAETIEQQPQEQAQNAVSIEEAKLPEPEIIDTNASVEEQSMEAEPQQQLKGDSPIINIMQLNHLPQDYQIPVQVVSMPEPEREPSVATEIVKQTETEAESKPEEVPVQEDDAAQQNLAAAAYMPPISIDDIVELVKERLDQTPKNEELKPMELVLTPGEPMTLIDSTAETKLPEKDVEAELETAAVVEAGPAQEDVIVPIYKRVTDAEPVMSQVQTAPVTANKVEEPAEQVGETKSKSLMDARKRRFLFRADAS
ncbi:calphotin [Drosophila busckii]|uniref:calphotin n=1 Tax=Drosophila busckii TaxID=30019 RepID=UPI001433435C|nr:calphotin [Drosophila busckii]